MARGLMQEGYDCQRAGRSSSASGGAYETPFEPWNPRSRAEAPTPNLRAALGDAAFMTQMEKNSDIVVMNCYAPMFVNVNPGARQWRPNLIGYDGLRVYGSPSYYAIKLFSTNLGDEILKMTAADTEVLMLVTLGTASLVPSTPSWFTRPMQTRPSRSPSQEAAHSVLTATALTLSGDAQATNAIDTPDRVVPVTSTVSSVKSGFTYTVPKHGIVVLTMRSR